MPLSNLFDVDEQTIYNKRRDIGLSIDEETSCNYNRSLVTWYMDNTLVDSPHAGDTFSGADGKILADDTTPPSWTDHSTMVKETKKLVVNRFNKRLMSEGMGSSILAFQRRRRSRGLRRRRSIPAPLLNHVRTQVGH
jgi:hypothetical protein